MRQAVLSTYGAITFEHTLRYVWSLGIPVLPLRDPGAFHGACWRIDGRNIIVLKQRTLSLARWLADLLHEVRVRDVLRLTAAWIETLEHRDQHDRNHDPEQ